MSEGPANFGKPLLYLVLIGVGVGGVYLYTHYPHHVDGSGWGVDFPHGWNSFPVTDPDSPVKVSAKGPMPDDTQDGAGFVSLNPHGAIVWPDFVFTKLPATTDWHEDTEIDYKKTVIFTYSDGTFRYIGVGVQRGDLVVIACAGCPAVEFDKNRPILEKCVRSLRCSR